jgi:hypothetical protein
MGEAKRKRQAEVVALGAVASGALIPFVSLDDRAASIRLHIASARASWTQRRPATASRPVLS